MFFPLGPWYKILATDHVEHSIKLMCNNYSKCKLDLALLGYSTETYASSVIRQCIEEIQQWWAKKLGYCKDYVNKSKLWQKYRENVTCTGI